MTHTYRHPQAIVSTDWLSAHLEDSNLRIYEGADHPHEAQQPEVVDVAALNAKNKFRG